jgi:hypothetical protein
MKIRILQGFGDYHPGQVFDDWPGGMAQILIGRGLIEEVRSTSEDSSDVDPKAVETADVDPEVERADASPKRKKK